MKNNKNKKSANKGLQKPAPKKVTAKAANPKKANPDKVRSFKLLGGFVGLGLGLALCIELGFRLFDLYIETERMNKLQELAQQHAEASAKNVALYIDDVWKKLERYSSRSSFVQAVVEQDEQQKEKYLKELHSYIDEIISVKIFLKGKAELNDEVFPPIRFSEMELIRLAENGQRNPPEAANFDGEWYLTFVSPLYQSANQTSASGPGLSPGQASEREVVATLLLTLSADPLAPLIIRDQASLGSIKLHQKFNEQIGQVVFKSGTGSLGEAVTVEVPNSHWEIGFQASYAMKSQIKTKMISSYLMIGGILLLVLGVSTSLGYFVGFRIEKKKKTEALIAAGGAVEEKKKEKAPVGPGLSLSRAADILDVEIDEVGEDLLGLEDVKEAASEEAPPVDEKDSLHKHQMENAQVPSEIFRAYDIRGVAKTQITRELAELIGKAIGCEAIDAAQDTLIVARDVRTSSPEITEWMLRGILSTGCNVINIGTVPTPLLYFATCTLEETQSGVMVTASHNTKEFNGFKIVIKGKSREAEDIKAIRRRILDNKFYQGKGSVSNIDISQKYIDTIFSDVALAGDVSIVIDAGNGVTGQIAPALFEEVGCNVHRLYCDFNGEFPNHDPDPSVEKNLQDLIAKVKETKADLGVAFDGDGDRLVVVTPSGKIIWPDQLLMLFAKDVLSRNPGADVVFDVKSTKHLASCVANNGGRPIMWKTGHAPMKNKMLETGALVGGEYSGHIFIKERWYGFDDGMYAAARLIEIISLQGQTIDEVFAEFPTSPMTPEIRVKVEESQKFEIIKKLGEVGTFEGGRVVDIDGIRVEYPFGWGLIRASNTSANLTLRFEADDEDSIHKLKSIFVIELKKVDPTIQINWKS